MLIDHPSRSSSPRRSGARFVLRRHRSLRPARWLVAALSVVAASAWSPGAASAGEFHVFMCQTPTGHNTPLANFSFDTGGLSNIGADNTCGSRGGMVGLWLGSQSRSGGQRVLGRLLPPYLSMFRSIEVNRQVFLGQPAGGDTAASPAWFQFRDSPVLDDRYNLEGCMWFMGCQGLDPENGGVVGWRFEQMANSIYWMVTCGGDPRGGCAAGKDGASRVAGLIRSVHVVLGEYEMPTAKVTGQAVQGGQHTGVEPLTVEASDYGAGVLDAYVTLNDQVVARGVVGGNCADQGNTEASEFDYEVVNPCPKTRRFDLDVDTRRVPDGRQTLKVFVRDAAGNVYAQAPVVLDIENVPPPKVLKAPTITGPSGQVSDLRPGDLLNVSDGVWEGANLRFTYQWQRSGEADYADIPNQTRPRYEVTADDVGHQLRVLVTATNREGQTVAKSDVTSVVKSGATVRPQSLAPSSTTVEGAPQLVLDREQRSVQVSRNAKIVVTGRLVDADGQPIADAEVEVFEQVAVVGAPWKRVTTVRTDGQGGYVYRPATTGSRTLRFAYSARRDSGDYRATREVAIAVTADMRLRAVPRVVRRGGVFKLRGRVMVDPLPAAGTWVEVQVLDAGVWRTVGTRHTSSTGRWSFRHRVQRVAGVTFTFRARLRPTADVPAAESKSAPVKVRVR